MNTINNSVKMRRSHHGKTIIYILLILGSFIMIFPFLWMIITSIKSFTESTLIPPTMFPHNVVFENYPDVCESLPFGSLYFNTLVLIFIRIICATIFCSMAGFAFAKLKFPLKNLMFIIILTQLMLPSQVFVLPQYKMVANLGQLNTLFALVFPGLVSAFGTFFLRQFYMTLPDDLMEAAKLDGCNIGQTFLKIMFPLTKTSVMALGIFTAIIAYGEMMWPLIVNSDITKMTLASGISTLQGQYMTDFPKLMAGSTLAMLPMLILYLLFQRQFVEGIALTGTKG